ncbi:MAG: glycoside hydrolase family 95 protein [Caldilineaceae bacterium]|nr:glycoside hydrolase family 95 protein [Caldilineaceae bacterium]
MTEHLTFFYNEAAETWYDALPVGNGRLGAMIYGGACAERVYLSDITFWSGEPSQANSNPDGPAIVAAVRRLLLAGDLPAANQLCTQIEGRKLNYGTNLPFGNLRLFMAHGDEGLRHYRRTLDLDQAIASVHYELNGVTYHREIFASHPAGVLVMQITASQPGRVGLRVGLDGDEQPFTVYTHEPATIGMDVLAREHFHSDGKSGVDGHARLLVRAAGGRVSTYGSQLVVEESDSVTLLLAFASTFDHAEPATVCQRRLATLVTIPYAELRAQHVADHQQYFRRVSLDLGAAPQPDQPLDARIAAVQQGTADPALAALLFQFGRYLLIGASRPDSPLPAHLLGVWNDNVACRIGWTCDYHLDINTQMNYWIAELTNLSECHAPLLRWIEQVVVPSGRHTARTLYGLPGWVAHIFANAWGFTAPGWSIWWGMHPTGGVWLAMHLWDHYQFTGDRAFLARHAYPILKEAAEFFLTYLVQDPATGWLLSGPANSPENPFLFQGQAYPVSLGPTVDNVLLRALFTACIEASTTLAVDPVLRGQLTAARAKLPPFQIGSQGQLQEWLADYDDALPHHRHTSHLLSVFPFDQITPEGTPELAQAVKVSITRREAPPTGYEEGSWGRNLIMLYHARLGDAAAAAASLLTLYQQEGDRSLMMGPKLAPRQAYELDYNTGATAAIAEMMLQSHQGYLHLLPALPTAWAQGRVTGLCGRGGFVVDLTWQAGQVTQAHIHSRLGGLCRLRLAGTGTISHNGQPVATTAAAPGIIEFATQAGQTYIVQVLTVD